jgi:hypothetical protein
VVRRELFFGDRSSFKAGGHERGSPVGSFGTLALSRGFGRAFPVPFFSSGSRRVFGGASFVVRNAGGPPSSRAAASGPPAVIRGTPGMAIQSPSVMNWGRGGVLPNRTRMRS